MPCMTRFITILRMKHTSLCVYNAHTTHTETHTYLYLDGTLSLSVDGELGCSHILAIVNNALMNMGVTDTSLTYWFHIHWIYIPRSRLAGSQGSSIFILLRISLTRAIFKSEIHRNRVKQQVVPWRMGRHGRCGSKDIEVQWVTGFKSSGRTNKFKRAIIHYDDYSQ